MDFQGFLTSPIIQFRFQSALHPLSIHASSPRQPGMAEKGNMYIIFPTSPALHSQVKRQKQHTNKWAREWSAFSPASYIWMKWVPCLHRFENWHIDEKSFDRGDFFGSLAACNFYHVLSLFRRAGIPVASGLYHPPMWREKGTGWSVSNNWSRLNIHFQCSLLIYLGMIWDSAWRMSLWIVYGYHFIISYDPYQQSVGGTLTSSSEIIIMECRTELRACQVANGMLVGGEWRWRDVNEWTRLQVLRRTMCLLPRTLFWLILLESRLLHKVVYHTVPMEYRLLLITCKVIDQFFKYRGSSPSLYLP